MTTATAGPPRAVVDLAHTHQMPVGEYAGIPLQDPADTWRHGAVFLLRKAARRSASVSLDGWVTSVAQNASVVVACGPSTAVDFDRTFSEALKAANRGLDYMSVQGQADCAVRDAPDDCLVWWPDPALGGIVMRCRAIVTMGFTLSATGVVKDAAGNVVPSPPLPSAVADDAFRFVRICRTSDDLYDSYRNLFLAFECLLSDIRPRRRVPIPSPQRRWWPWRTAPSVGTKWETEHDWFMDALDLADKLVPLNGLTPMGVTNHKRWIYRRMYSAERSALMHAKRGQNYLLPHDATGRLELIASLGNLWDYIKDLIEQHLGVTHLSSNLSLFAVEQMCRNTLPQFAMVVSDDDSTHVNPKADNPIAQGSGVVDLQSAGPAVDPEDPELWTLQADVNAADLLGLSTIRRFGLKNLSDGSLHVLSELVGPLTLGSSVARLQMVHGMRHVNPSGPPRLFSS